MQNLHLKNLNNIDPIDIYVDKIEKIYHNKDKFKELVTLLTKLYIQIEKELKSIKITSSTIQAYRDYIVDYLWDIQEHELRYPAKNAYSIQNYYLLTEIFKDNIKKLKLLKDIEIDSKMIKIEHKCKYNKNHPEYNKELLLIYFENHFIKKHRDIRVYINKNNIIKNIILSKY
jgi:hypothetical protein